MGACAALTKLRPEIVNLDLDTQLAMIRAAHEADARAYADCTATRDRLVEWIKADRLP